MSTTYTIHVDWTPIHTAMEKLDRARAKDRLGYDGLTDAFGGTYHGFWFEDRGLAGLAELSDALDRIAEDAWQAVHKAHRRLYDRQEQVKPKKGDWWVVDPARASAIKESDSRRGARCIATTRRSRFAPPFRVMRGDELRAEIRREEIARAQRAARVAIAVAHAKTVLAQTGIRPEPKHEICGTGVGYGLTGLGWLAGWAREDRGAVTSEMVERFAETGTLDHIRAA